MKPLAITGTVLAGLLVGLPVLWVLATAALISSANAACVAEAGQASIGALRANLPSRVGAWHGDQLANAAEIIAAGQDLHLDSKTITIGVMTAMGESSLLNLDYGDAAGPDSRGLFQQRDNGAWGTLHDRTTPRIAATNFFKALVKVPGYLRMQPTLAARRSQGNADPYYYTPFWDDAVKVVTALTDDIDHAEQEPTGEAAAVDDTMVWPVGENVPRGAEYHQAGSAWSSGFHTGTDFNPGAGTPVHAAHAGKVTESTDAGGPYGRTVVVTWQQGASTYANRYAHLQVRRVQVGDQVAAGDVVGTVGWSGNVRPAGPAGAHLHFELLIDGELADPLAWLQGEAVEPPPGDAGAQSCPDQPGYNGDIPPVNREANRAALQFALTQIGHPYARGGGTGPAYGCNGFAWRSWHEAGSRWPLMLADEQGTTGRWVTEIPQDEAQPGDLVVFWYANGTDTTPDVRWDHVGIVLDPQQGTYVNAANPDAGVKISDWDDYTGPRMGFTRVRMT